MILSVTGGVVVSMPVSPGAAVAKKKRASPKREKLSPEEREQRRIQRAYSRRIRETFTRAGFDHLATDGKEFVAGLSKVELDAVYVYRNVILIVEDTTSKDPRSHLKKKHLAASQILDNPGDLLKWLREHFPERIEAAGVIPDGRYQLRYLYFSRHPLLLSETDVSLFAPCIVVEESRARYLHQLSRTIHYSARNEILQFLEIPPTMLGASASSAGSADFSTTIIYPEGSVGLPGGVTAVSFMMSADFLLRNSYVLRKDGWEESAWLYQRLLDPKKIAAVRRFIARDNGSFLNNVIVSLPRTAMFKDSSNKQIDIASAQEFTEATMVLPDSPWSIALIDGQHRVYAHYEGNDALEPAMAKVRSTRHLLVTGLVFPEDTSVEAQRQLESAVFVDINSNAKNVPADVLLYVSSLRQPFSDVSIARRVLVKLNQSGAFHGMLQLSLLSEAPIPVASIIRFALRRVVTLTPADGAVSLFASWTAAEDVRNAVRKGENVSALEDYVAYCATTIGAMFSALKQVHADDWKDPDSRILSITSINGFVLAFGRSLSTLGPLSRDEYVDRFQKAGFKFDRPSFSFASSQYAMFSTEVEAKALAPTTST
jgi:DGQHR domain-containing protein